MPSEVQKIIVGDKEIITDRPGKHASIDFDAIKDELAEKIKDIIEVWSYLMYPQVFLDFNRMHGKLQRFTVEDATYFYGVKTGEKSALTLKR